MIRKPLERRTFLRGLGTVVALPMLDAMLPRSLMAQGTTPKRYAVLFAPNGMDMKGFRPSGEGSNYTLSYSLKPLEALKSDILVISGLDNPSATWSAEDGTGDHARSAGTFLINVRVLKSESTLRAAVSVDQIAAATWGSVTPLRSLEVGCEGGTSAGGCDSGYSCAYSRTISWNTPTTPNPKEVNPRIVFDRMFAAGGGAQTPEQIARRNLYKKSILDFVMSDTQRLLARLGTSDKAKMDEYLTRVREVEQRIGQQEARTCSMPGRPSGTPDGYDAHVRIMMDLMALAFQCDLTRVCTFMFANEGTNQNYPFIGINDGHHDLSHHGEDEAKKDKLRQINRWQMTQLAYFIDKLKNMSEAGGSVLSNSAILCGAGIEDGNSHVHTDLPIIVAGQAGGNISTGRHIVRNENLANLHVAMLRALGLNVASHGDSTRALSW